MLHIDPSLEPDVDDVFEINIYDENALRAATVLVRTVGDAVEIEVQRIENDPPVIFKVP